MAQTILILHGWGLFGKRYETLQKMLEKKGYKVYSPDLPGFGNEPLVKDPMNLQDYAEFVALYIQKKKLGKVWIIAHSFGGRVAARLAADYPQLVGKLVLTGSPLIRAKLSLRKKIMQYIVKKGQQFSFFIPKVVDEPIRWLIYRAVGEFDYYKAKKLKATFKAIINENASEYLPKIKIPVLLLWGEDDKLATLAYGKKIIEKIPHAKLEIIKNAGHGIPYTHTKQFVEKTLDFFNS